MAITQTTIRPGYLVNIRTSIKGNVEYTKSEETVRTEGGTEVSEWTTERLVKNAKEQAEAVEIRSKARQMVAGICIQTEFAMLCLASRRAELDEAFDRARALCVEFNRNSTYTRIKFVGVAGFIADNDETAIKAIRSEMTELLEEITAGIDGLDPERVKDAAARAKKIGNMLPDEMQVRLNDTLKDVRKVAKKMVEAGEQVAIEIDAEVLNKITFARTAFLDIDGGEALEAPEDDTGRAVDLHPAEDGVEPAEEEQREVELDLADLD